jgi:hypothetical protein
MNNVFLWLALEENEIIKASVLEKYAKGDMKLTIPYTQSFRIGSNSTSTNMSIQLNRNYGKQIRRIMFTAYQGSEVGVHTYNNSNGLLNNVASKILSYQTYLNNKPLQDIVVNCDDQNIDYAFNKEWLKNSCLSTVNDYRYNWFHIDNFSTIADKSNNMYTKMIYLMMI